MKLLKRVVSQRGLNDLFRMMENLDSAPCEIHLIIEEIEELWNVEISGFLEEFS